MTADALSSGRVTLEPGVPTPLAGAGRKCLAVTIWNRTGYDLGVGGPELRDTSMLPDGGSFRVPIRSASLVWLLSAAASPVEVAYTIEE